MVAGGNAQILLRGKDGQAVVGGDSFISGGVLLGFFRNRRFPGQVFLIRPKRNILACNDFHVVTLRMRINRYTIVFRFPFIMMRVYCAVCFPLCRSKKMVFPPIRAFGRGNILYFFKQQQLILISCNKIIHIITVIHQVFPVIIVFTVCISGENHVISHLQGIRQDNRTRLRLLTGDHQHQP